MSNQNLGAFDDELVKALSEPVKAEDLTTDGVIKMINEAIERSNAKQQDIIKNTGMVM